MREALEAYRESSQKLINLCAVAAVVFATLTVIIIVLLALLPFDAASLVTMLVNAVFSAIQAWIYFRRSLEVRKELSEIEAEFN